MNAQRDRLLELVDGATAKRMFGGEGIYADGVMFAVAHGGALYLKVDEESRPEFEALGSGPFTPNARQTIRSFYELPGEVADDDAELAEALDRWELSLFQREPARSEQLRESLSALLAGADGPWAAALRAATLLGETPEERGDLLATLRTIAPGERQGTRAADAVRRALVDTLLHGDRRTLIASVDETLIGVRTRPARATVTALAG